MTRCLLHMAWSLNVLEHQREKTPKMIQHIQRTGKLRPIKGKGLTNDHSQLGTELAVSPSFPVGVMSVQVKPTVGFIWGLNHQHQWLGPCLPAREKLAPRRRADGLDIVILQLDTLGCQPVQRRGFDI